jgi:serine protease inhibitor
MGERGCGGVSAACENTESDPATHRPALFLPRALKYKYSVRYSRVKIINRQLPRAAGSPDLAMDPAFVDVVNGFGVQLQSLIMEPDKPTGLCALNIYHCLAMVAAGSKDRILAAFSQVLGFDANDLKEMVHNTVQLNAYTKKSTAVEFNTTSSIWHHNDFILETPWLNIIQSTFGATIGPLETKPINDFIFRETKGKFKDLIKEDDLAGAVLMLITCLYFKAKWQNPFEKWRTTEKSDFFTWQGKTQVCAMMHKVERIEYVEDKEMQACFLPYQSGQGSSGPQWKAAVILPKRNGMDAMQDILTSFSKNPEALVTLLKGVGGSHPAASSSSRLSMSSTGPPVAARTQKISLSLPRFSLRINLDLIPALEKLGLGPAFQASEDFAPISTGPLVISRVTHDLFLEVNEEGTEIAAVTVVAMRSVPLFFLGGGFGVNSSLFFGLS